MTTSLGNRDYEVSIQPFPTIQKNALRALRPQQNRLIVSDAAQTATSNTTLTASDTFVFPDLVPGQYILRASLALSINTAAHNLKFDFGGGTASATAVGRTFLGITAAAGTQTGITALTTLTDGSTTTSWTSFDAWLTIVVTSAGSIALRYAQSASGATASTISAGSYMELLRVT